MREVARVSCLSPGGIYHYFRSKTDLLLYGLDPEALARACSDAADELAVALRADGATPDTVIELYVERNLIMLDFVRPALQAAIELGRPELRRRLAPGLLEDADALVSSLRAVDPDSPVAPEAAAVLRRTILGLALDESVSREEARRQLTWLLAELRSP